MIDERFFRGLCQKRLQCAQMGSRMFLEIEETRDDNMNTFCILKGGPLANRYQYYETETFEQTIYTWSEHRNKETFRHIYTDNGKVVFPYMEDLASPGLEARVLEHVDTVVYGTFV